MCFLVDVTYIFDIKHKWLVLECIPVDKKTVVQIRLGVRQLAKILSAI